MLEKERGWRPRAIMAVRTMLEECSVLKLVTARLEDTPPDVAAAFTALVMQRSEGERVMMALEMFDLARALMTADLRSRHPGISETELRVQIFERTYGSDFDETERGRIVQRMRGGAVDETWAGAGGR